MKNFGVTVVIGRFQPFHKGHLNLIHKAMLLAPKTFVFLGSDNATRTPKNIWTTSERLQMIKPCFLEQELQQIIFAGLPDYQDDQDWVNHIQEFVYSKIEPSTKVALVGFRKDMSSYYLSLFKKWSFINAEQFCHGLNASDLRAAYFDGLPPDPAYLPAPVIQFLCDFRQSPEYPELKQITQEMSEKMGEMP